jgi:hypothetical protein
MDYLNLQMLMFGFVHIHFVRCWGIRTAGIMAEGQYFIPRLHLIVFKASIGEVRFLAYYVITRNYLGLGCIASF